MSVSSVALVTGGNRGLGLEIGRQLSRLGFQVVVPDEVEGVPLTRIGVCTKEADLIGVHADGRETSLRPGFQHFGLRP